MKAKPTLIFAGTSSFARTMLQALIHADYEILAVYTQPDRPSGRGQKITPGPVKDLALNHHFIIEQPQSLRDTPTQAHLESYHPDLMIVAAYGLILPSEVLNIPTYGCINVHASLLPRWRGAAPIQRALLAGDKETGITIMQMAQGLDTGPILSQSSCPILDEDTAGSLHDRLAYLGAEELLIALKKLTLGELKPLIQDDSKASYASKINKQEARIDWNQSSEYIVRLVRAMNPWPIAFTQLGELSIRIWQAEAISNSSASPIGTVIKADTHGVDVVCKKGIVRLTSLQFPGGKALNAKDIINAKKLKVGQTFA